MGAKLLRGYMMADVSIEGVPGLTLRDYFAAQAANGLLAGLAGDDAVKMRPEAAAAMAYWVADAMMAARTAPPIPFPEEK